MYGRMAGFAGPISPRPARGVVYTAGLYRTTYSGYFADSVSFFAQATATATLVQTTVIEEPSTDAGSNFSMQWLGYFRPTTTETYKFFLSSDDASYWWIGSNVSNHGCLKKIYEKRRRERSVNTVDIEQQTHHKVD